ncbi:Hypothetical predicted protein [Octopus vulgaris]|uniref:Uncharacterized protein n=1 Tax=Octopus vulgaris TaxID=6645 RepID=A0AA36F5E9_OCTVU|nr:Hypothetical predicted protein [Octopus vulgaris]
MSYEFGGGGHAEVPASRTATVSLVTEMRPCWGIAFVEFAHDHIQFSTHCDLAFSLLSRFIESLLLFNFNLRSGCRPSTDEFETNVLRLNLCKSTTAARRDFPIQPSFSEVKARHSI